MALFDLHTGSIVANVSEPTTVLEPTADGAALEAAAAAGGAVALRFLAFGDGRGYSLAVLLRERHGFTEGSNQRFYWAGRRKSPNPNPTARLCKRPRH